MRIENYRMATEFGLGHDGCRSKVSVVCYEKASCILLDIEIETVDRFLIVGNASRFSMWNLHRLQYWLDVDFKIPVLESYDLESKVLFRLVGTCSCIICTVAKRNRLSVLQLWQKNLIEVDQHQSLLLVM